MAKKVIIADDDEQWREMHKEVIQRSFPDANIDEVETGTDLVERVLHGDYSLVLSDNNMERTDAGLDALRKIREAGNGVPFYVICAGDSKIAERALLYGANGFYDKAEYDSDKIVEDITKHLQ